MIKKFTVIKSLLLITSLGLGVTSYIGQAQAQQVAKMRFVWNFTAPSGAVYLNICSEPKFNINERTGGCAQIDILNSNVTKNQDRTRLVTDRLKLGQEYKACLVADNTFGNKQGRWIDCVDFTAVQGQTISFSIS